MKFRNFVLITVIVIVFQGCGYWKPKVLIIGDSISIGYTQHVRNYFKGEARVHHNLGNAKHTGTGLERLEDWLGDTEWNVIIFNWGLWDIFQRWEYVPTGNNEYELQRSITCTIDEYTENLNAIVLKLKKTNAKLVFVTTTYVPDNSGGRFKPDVLKYNKAAKEVMQRNEIYVNDIFEESKAIHQKHAKGKNDVHYTEEGYKQLASLIVRAIEPEIQRINEN